MKAKKAILRQEPIKWWAPDLGNFFFGGGGGGAGAERNKVYYWKLSRMNTFWKRRVAGNGLQGKADNRPLWLVCFVFPKKVPGELELCLFINYAYICMWIRRKLTVLSLLSHGLYWEYKTCKLKRSFDFNVYNYNKITPIGSSGLGQV